MCLGHVLHISSYNVRVMFAPNQDMELAMMTSSYMEVSMNTSLSRTTRSKFEPGTVNPAFKGHLNIPEKVSLQDRVYLHVACSVAAVV